MVKPQNPINPDNKNRKRSKRELLDFLPSVLQTPVLKSFFRATVDQLYQPQEVEELVGYIGNIPSYHKKETDFYIEEISKKRKLHQLTHAATFTSANSVEFLKFYDNVIDYLKYNGSLVSDHNRLFSEEFYSWMPPINIDAFINFRNYYWLPFTPDFIVIEDPTNLDSIVGQQYAQITVNGQPLNLRSHMIIFPKNDVNPDYNNKPFIVEGVGKAIVFVLDEVGLGGWDIFPWDTEPFDNTLEVSEVPDYFVMERGAKDKNSWSRKNRWFHRDEILNFDDPNLVKIRAKRPIIIFERDLELWNHGTNFVTNVDLVSFCPELFSVLNNLSPTYGIPPYGGVGIPCIENDITFSEQWPDAGKGISGVKVKDGFGGEVQISNNMLILFADSSSPGANNRIYKVTGISDTNPVIQLEPFTGFPSEGDYVTFVDSLGFEHNFVFDGQKWKEGQAKTRINQPPLFQLYDINLVKLDDESVYNSSNFSGSRIFGYAIDETNTTSVDTELNLRPVFNENGRYVFENYLNTERWSFIDTVTGETKEIPYYYFWRINSPFEHLHEYGNNWNLSKEKSKQYIIEQITISMETNIVDIPVLPITPIIDSTRFYTESLIVKVDGKKKEYLTDWTLDTTNKRIQFTNNLEKQSVVEIKILPEDTVTDENLVFENPMSLVRNAENKDVERVSYDDVFLHFTENMRKQINFSGSEFGINNFKDTPAERWKGERIVQHTNPILKLFLVSDENTPFVESLRYVEREFIRFKNKFLKKTEEFWKNGKLPTTNPDDWVDEILKEINFGKNLEFPFKNTGVDLQAGDKNVKYIPASPAFLGITPLYKPEIYVDDKLGTSLIRQHDGSVIATFGDFRDNVLLRLEERIFESAPDKFKEDYIPILPIHEIREGKWRKTDYNRKDFIELSRKIFNRWLAENGISFDDFPTGEDNFSINYSTVKDKDGEELPGNWRGIYLWYYDTDRPDLFPWEMLGFSIKPDWWDAEYGPAPYTSGNSKLWDDLEAGRIRQGKRAGIDTRFARPGLSKYIPVSSTGELLDPVSIGIASTYPLPQNATKPFEFGDVGTIEFAWTKSENYSFDLSLILFLAKPAKFVSVNWNSLDYDIVFRERTDATDEQHVFINYRHRPENKNLVVHNENSSIVELLQIPADTKKTKISFNNFVLNYGLQQWISNYLEKDSKDITENFGNKLRGITSNLAYRAGKFIDASIFRADSDSFGLIPKENIRFTFHKEKFIDESIYSAVIIEKVNDGFIINGYDFFNKVFRVLERNKLGKNRIIGVGQTRQSVKRWVENTQYFVGDIVILENSGQLYKAKETHISGEIFDPTKWVSIQSVPYRFKLTAKVYEETTGKIIEVPYGTKLKNVQDVVDFLVSYQDYLESIGFVFDNFDTTNNEMFDFVKSAKEFMLWSISGIEENDVISLSPLSKEVKFETDFGMISSIETESKGFYSIINRFGKKIPPKNTTVIRDENTVRIFPVNENDENSLIYFTRLSKETIEHAIVFDNKTIFDNIINDGLLGVHLSRIRISTVASKFWNGKYEAAGFIITPDNILVPNYDKLADQFRFIFDINDTTNTESLWKNYSFHNIGYQERDYLSKLIISDKSQVNFYQGLVKTKGTKQSIDKILRSQFVTTLANVELLEEWMFFGSEYGNVDDNRRLVIKLDSNLFKQDPQIITFPVVETESIVSGSPNEPSSLNKNYFYNTSSKTLFKKNENGDLEVLYDWSEVVDRLFVDSPFDEIINYRIATFGENIVFSDFKILEKPSDIDFRFEKKNWIWNNHYTYVDFKFPFAGHLLTSEADFQFFDKTSFMTSANPDEIEIGDRIWIYEVSDIKNSKYKDWSVFEVLKVSAAISSLSAIIDPSGNNEMKISFISNLGTSANRVFLEGDIVILKTADDTDFKGIYEIKRTEGLKEIIVSAKEGFNEILDASALSTINSLELLTLVEARFKNIEEIETLYATNYYLLKEHDYSDKLLFVDDIRNKNERFFVKEYYGTINVTDFEPLNPPGNKLSYSIVRKENKSVNTELFENIIVRDTNTKSVLANLPVYDPLMGKLVPIFKVNIDFMTFYDPAIYTDGDNELFNIEPNNTSWNKNKVGKRWFNTRKAKFLDYKTTVNTYARDNWGKLAEKSTVEIAEWIESDVPPSLYNGEGIPLYGENSPYVTVTETNTLQGVEQTKYYFWVIETNNVPEGKTLSINELASIIKNPSANGYNWYSPLDSNTIILSLNQSLREDTFITISWNDRRIDDIPHKEWIIAKEGTSSWLPPDKLWNKMVDSLVGFDFQNKPVPDPRLPEEDRSGISIRPRRTMFLNRNEAVRNFVYFINKKFEKIRFLENSDFSKIIIEEPKPTNTDFTVDNFIQRDSLVTSNSIAVGQTVLVESEISLSNFWSVWELVSIDPLSWKLVDIQKYRTEDFIEITDFYSEEVDKNFPPTKIFSTTAERNTALTQGIIEQNEIIEILDNGFGSWEWQKWNGTAWITLAKEKSTIKLKETLYKNKEIFGIYIDQDLNLNVEELKNKIDNRDGRLELREILEVIKNETILGLITINEIFFTLIRYLLTESENNSSWIVKLSTLVLGNIIQTTSRDTTVRPDIVSSMIDYLEEVKPYRSKFREITKTLSPERDDLNLVVDDFDISQKISADVDFNLLRKFEQTIRFDRVSCEESEVHPEKIIFQTDGINFIFDLFGTSSLEINTEPLFENYNPFDTGKQNIWNKSNIRNVSLFFPNGTSTILSKNDYNIEISVSSISVIFNQIYDSGTRVVIERWITAFERLMLYYKNVSTNIFGKELVLPQPPLNTKSLISGCEFKGIIIEGGGFELTPEYFNAVQDNILIHIYNPFPNENFFLTNLAPVATPDGIVFKEYVDSRGDTWFESYVSSYSKEDEFLKSWSDYYGFGVTPYPGNIFQTDNTIAVSVNSVDFLYDIIVDGIKTSGTTWQTVSSPFSPVYEGGKFVQPHISRDHPEELMPITFYDTSLIRVYRTESSGYPSMENLIFNYSDEELNKTRIILDGVPHNRESLIIFNNGILLKEGEDYNFNYEKLEITFVSSSPKITSNNQLDIRYFEAGGDANLIAEKHAFLKEISLDNNFKVTIDNIIDTSIDDASKVYATVDGYEILVAISANNLEFTIPSAVPLSSNSILSFYLFDSTEITKTRREEITASSLPFTFEAPASAFSKLPNLNNILIFSDGKMLCPPYVEKFVTVEGDTTFVSQVDISSGVVDLRAYYNNQILELSADYTVSSVFVSSLGYNVNKIDLLINVSSGGLFELVTLVSGKFDYDISDVSGKITVYNSFSSSLTYFWWDNNEIMDLNVKRTFGPYRKTDNLEKFLENTFSLFVSENGIVKTPSIDYTKILDKQGWDIFSWDSFGWDETFLFNEIIYKFPIQETCMFYIAGKERGNLNSFLKIKNTNYSEKFVTLRKNLLFTLESDVETDTSAIFIRENIDLHPALRFRNVVLGGNVSENDSNVIWIGTEKIAYSKASVHQEVSGHRIWKLENVNRGISNTPHGVSEDRLTLFVIADGSSKTFTISGLSTILTSAADINISLVTYASSNTILIPNYPFNIVPVDEMSLIKETSASAASEKVFAYYINGDNVTFGFVPPAAKNIQVLVSGTAQTTFLPNIYVDIVLRNWDTTNVSHEKNELVIVQRSKPIESDKNFDI